MVSKWRWMLVGAQYLWLAVLLSLGSAGFSLAADKPMTVTLNSGGEYFEEVLFDHGMHEEVGECSDCHHHTTGGGTNDTICAECHADSPESEVVACRGCHVAQPFSADAVNQKAGIKHQYHVDTPGLKGAVHRNCLGCHEEQDGPIGCQDCHGRTERGDKLYTGTLGKD